MRVSVIGIAMGGKEGVIDCTQHEIHSVGLFALTGFFSVDLLVPTMELE